MFAQEEDDLHTPLLRQFGSGQRIATLAAEPSGRPIDRRPTAQRNNRRRQRRNETFHESLDFDPILNSVTAATQESVRPLRCEDHLHLVLT